MVITFTTHTEFTQELRWWDAVKNRHDAFIPKVIAEFSFEDYETYFNSGKRPTQWLHDNNRPYCMYRTPDPNFVGTGTVQVYLASEDDAVMWRLTL